MVKFITRNFDYDMVFMFGFIFNKDEKYFFGFHKFDDLPSVQNGLKNLCKNIKLKKSGIIITPKVAAVHWAIKEEYEKEID